jgi:hypothetical protein
MELFQLVVYSLSSKVVNTLQIRGSNETVDVIIEDSGTDKQETRDRLAPGEVAKHRSTG